MTGTAEPLVVQSTCAVCGDQDDLTSPRPSWAQVSGFEDCVQWRDTPQLPEPGARHRLHVRHPFRASSTQPFWVLYQPPCAAVNGWEEHPEELAVSGIVSCQLCEDLGPDGRGRQVRVTILQSIPLERIPSRFPPECTPPGAPLPTEPASESIDVLRWEGFTMRSWNAQSNIGAWALYLKQDAHVALILSGSWGFHDSTIAAGCRRLTAEEAHARGLG